MSTVILDTARTGATALSIGWIISKRDDLAWFIGSSILGYVALAGLATGLPAMTAFLVWKLAIDGPHVFATASRSYFDSQARGRLGWRLWMIVPLILLGPAMWMAGQGPLFVIFLLTWAQYHVAKQHLGLVMLYKRKSQESVDYVLDRRFIVGSLMAPWAIFLYVNGQLPASDKVILFGLVAYIPFLAFYVVRQYARFAEGQLNTPKIMLLGVVIPLHWIACLYAAGKPNGIIIAGIATNVGHSLQYHRLTWFHNSNRYDGPQFGLTTLISKRVLIYIAVAFLLNLVFWVIPYLAFAGNAVLLAALAGMNMTHYYLDSKIWRTREDKELASALRL